MSTSIDHLLSVTTAELLGIYQPSGTPMVRAGAGIPAEVTSVHETAHRALCGSSSYGQWLQALAVAYDRSDAAPSQAEVAQSLNEAVARCIRVQEGFATASQLIFCTYEQGYTEAGDQLVKTLPSLYLKAVAAFMPLVMFSTTAGSVPSKERAVVEKGAKYTASAVLAQAAMAVPFKAIVDSGVGLHSAELTRHLDAHAPDARLSKLVRSLSPDGWQAVFLECIPWVPLMLEARPIDDLGDALARKLCEGAGLQYEARDEVGCVRFLSALVPSGNFVVRDMRDLPVRQALAVERQVRLVSSRPLDAALVEDWHQTVELLNEALAAFAPEETRIVCELGVREGLPNYLLHLYVRANRMNGSDPAMVANLQALHDDVPYQLCSVATRVASFAEAVGLRRRIQATNWSWLAVTHVLAEEPSIAALRDCGSIHRIFSDGEYATPNAITTKVVRTLSAVLAGLPRHYLNSEWIFESVPEDAVLQISAMPDAFFTEPCVCLAPRLGSLISEFTSFEESCVADALYGGYHSFVFSAYHCMEKEL